MELEQGVDFVRQTLMMILVTSMPILAAALFVGLIVSVFQAVTQIQEQTLTFVPKIVTMGGMAILIMPWLVKRIMEFSTHMFAGY